MKPRTIGIIMVVFTGLFLFWQLNDMNQDCRVNSKSVGVFTWLFLLGWVQLFAPIDLEKLRKKYKTRTLKFSQYPLYWNVATFVCALVGLGFMAYLDFGYVCIPKQ